MRCGERQLAREEVDVDVQPRIAVVGKRAQRGCWEICGLSLRRGANARVQLSVS